MRMSGMSRPALPGGCGSISERLDQIVGLLHDAEVDASAWPAASALIDEVCGLAGNDLLLARPLAGGGIDIRLRWLFLRGERHPGLEREYADDYAAIDERMPAGLRLPPGNLVHTTCLLPESVRRRSTTYNEYLVPNAGENCLNVRSSEPRNLHAAWSLVGPGGGGPGDWTREQVAMVRALWPHVRQFVRVRYALAEARADGLGTVGLLDTRRFGVLLLDDEDRLVEANDPARAMLAASDGLRVSDGRLAANPPADADGLKRLLDGACLAGCSGSMPIVRPQGPPLVLHATPVGAGESLRGVRPCAARVLIADPFAAPTVDSRRLGAALGLTPAQATVAAALATGGTVETIAARTSRTKATVRWHIRQTLERLGLSRQADLVRVVLSTPGVLDGPD